MGKPADKFLPRRSEIIPGLFRQIETLGLIIIEHHVEFGGGVAVYDYSVLLVVPTKAARIKIGAAYGAESSINHYNLGMMESRLVQPYIHPLLHQFVYVVENAIGC